jgi:molybdate transport system substrate-binding protein
MTWKSTPIGAAIVCVAVLVLPAAARTQGPSPPLIVFAAADLGPAFRQLAPQFERDAHAKVTIVPGSTGTLVQQIRNGAPADVFFAASESAVADLNQDALVLMQSRRLYARGRLVVVTLKSSALQPNNVNDLADPRFRRIAIANPAHAPYGLAAQQALQKAGLWAGIEPKLVYGENVQQAVQFVQSGSADAGIVARSVVEDASLTWKIVDSSLHAPLNQFAVVLTHARQPALALSFIDFVNGARGRSVMKHFGFLIPGEDF